MTNESLTTHKGSIDDLKPKEQNTVSAIGLRATALQYVNAGLSVFPANDKKQPKVKHWTPYRDQPAQAADFDQWWPEDSGYIAIITGKGSENVELIDFDEKYNRDPERLFDQWKFLVDAECPGLVERLVREKTKNNGDHITYRCKTVEGNKKLAQRSATPEDNTKDSNAKAFTLIETRGEGGYFVCHPSPGYMLVNGSFLDLPEITPEERQTLLSCARALNQYIDPKRIVTGKKKSAVAGNRPGDHFNERGDHTVVLGQHGWQLVRDNGEQEYWRRPGKQEGISATFNKQLHCFYVFSSNAAPFEHDRAYDKFALYAYLEADADFRKAAQMLAQEGYGDLVIQNEKLEEIETSLMDKGEFRLNVVTQRTEARLNGSSAFAPLTDFELNSLYRALKKEGRIIGVDTLSRLLHSDFLETYDPFQEYFDDLPEWDGVTDHIKALANTAIMEDEKDRTEFEKCLERWLIGVVACATRPDAVNQTAIIFVGKQGIGKSRWLNRLVPPALDSYKFIGTVDPSNKDTEVYLSECLLINLDELETLRKKEIGELKTLMTKPSVKLRRPYDRLSQDMVRRASFVGSINQTEFLNDPTGSRRFLTFKVKSFDHSKTVDMDLVYAQAKSLLESGQQWWFDEKEIETINKRNLDFGIKTYEEELLLELTTSVKNGVWLTATQVAEGIKARRDDFRVDNRSVQKLGIALTKNGYEDKNTGGKHLYGIKWV